MFILNKEVTFNEEDGYLENPSLDVSVLMAASARRLLLVLITERGSPVERDYLFRTVWDEHGLRSSHSNLNQYISILRKTLVQAGLPDDAIITIPKIGFMFNPGIDVRTQVSLPRTESRRIKSLFNKFFYSNLYYPIYILCITSLAFGTCLIYFSNTITASVPLIKVTGYPPECNVFMLSGSPFTKVPPIEFVANSCNENQDVFIFNHAGKKEDKLIVSCEKGKPEYFTHCHNRVDVAG
ncbi:transcriptional regulator [Escherichia coli]|uniref:winged helix-turn-helix domain-containing protein n=1 Tax=Escherichia coli TaxID=562 RepID=UPI000BE5E7F5|nr:winged helix-turn-helix domain-containing protein [Escherichia coli]EEQ2597217.1 hypothetical protein [Escherichia coli]EEQ4335281.1 hypothetical protein [Escherichia coli]EEQ9544295.1 hypothetical protein [Escherichia coli]EEQ9574483.1 hypothetical protein [Escherichia coli]EER2015678.1 hypothetical protein [Escherichia coli]